MQHLPDVWRWLLLSLSSFSGVYKKLELRSKRAKWANPLLWHNNNNNSNNQQYTLIKRLFPSPSIMPTLQSLHFLSSCHFLWWESTVFRLLANKKLWLPEARQWNMIFSKWDHRKLVTIFFSYFLFTHFRRVDEKNVAKLRTSEEKQFAKFRVPRNNGTK